MNPAITNLMVSLGCMQVARRIPFDNPEVLTYVRIGYVASQLICLAVYYYVSTVIQRKNDTKVLKYVEPKPPLSQEPAKDVTTTNRDYDLSEVNKAIRGVLMGVLFMGFMHLYMKYTQPLFMQAVMAVKGLYDSKIRSPTLPSLKSSDPDTVCSSCYILKVHLLGQPATGDLKRPFVAAPAFGAAAPSNSNSTSDTPAAVTAASAESKKTK